VRQVFDLETAQQLVRVFSQGLILDQIGNKTQHLNKYVSHIQVWPILLILTYAAECLLNRVGRKVDGNDGLTGGLSLGQIIECNQKEGDCNALVDDG
jgi:hypothetical protein